MPVAITACRPVQIKIAVDNAEEAAVFYRDALGARWEVIRRTEDDGDVRSLVFGECGRDDFFLLVLVDRDDDDPDRPRGASTFGFMVDQLDAAHRRALSAGGTELLAPRSPEGMPRCSAVGDPSGNWIWLYQG
jgi:predicted enzyme related to lactoylglutathione lyase